MPTADVRLDGLERRGGISIARLEAPRAAAYLHPLDLEAAPALRESDGPAAPGLRIPGPDLYPREPIQHAGEEAAEVGEHRRSTRPIGPRARELVRFCERLVVHLTLPTLGGSGSRGRVAATRCIHGEEGAQHRGTDVPR